MGFWFARGQPEYALSGASLRGVPAAAPAAPTAAPTAGAGVDDDDGAADE